MGCSHNRQEIIIPKNHPPFHLRSTLFSIVQSLSKEFEDSLLEKLVLDEPRSIQEFNKLICSTLQDKLKKFDKQIEEFTGQKPFRSESSFFQNYLISKCKSKEGYYRNLNDFNSVQFIGRLRRNLMEQLNKGSIDQVQCLEMFSHWAKGTYVLKGLSDMHQLLALDEKGRDQYLCNEEEKEKNDLDEDKARLMDMSRKRFADLPDEIPSTAMSNLGHYGHLNGEMDSAVIFEDLESKCNNYK